MSKRNYKHIQEFLPEIEEMIAGGKSQREVAEHFGFKDKYVVKELLKRERRKQRKEAAGIIPQPKGRPGKDAASRDIVAEQAYEIKRLHEWRMKCCGIFCGLWEGGEIESKIRGHLPPPGRVSGIRHVPVVRGIQKRILPFCASAWQNGERCSAGRENTPTTG